jgi:sugar/nucleoside kinase (ribokinase family)
VNVDVVVVGSPSFDLVFEGLPRLPTAGEEIVGRAFHPAPGSTAIQAIGMARLGLSVTLVSPCGTDMGGRFLRETLQREGVSWTGADVPATPTTAVLSAADGTAMATAWAEGEPTAAEVEAVGASSAVLSLGRARLRPHATPACFITGTVEIEAGASVPDPRPGDSIVVNVDEARALTGMDDPDAAARVLAAGGRTAVITKAADGAVAAQAERLVRAAAPATQEGDATGAGDLFVAGFVWARSEGIDLEAALAWACLYAALSIPDPTAFAGARHLDELMREGRARGLTPP